MYWSDLLGEAWCVTNPLYIFRQFYLTLKGIRKKCNEPTSRLLRYMIGYKLNEKPLPKNCTSRTRLGPQYNNWALYSQKNSHQDLNLVLNRWKLTGNQFQHRKASMTGYFHHLHFCYTLKKKPLRTPAIHGTKTTKNQTPWYILHDYF